MNNIMKVLVCVAWIAASFALGFVNGGNSSQGITFLKEANAFKYELILAQDSVIVAQDEIISLLIHHCEDAHDCDVPVLDGNEYMNLLELQEKVDSLYSTQL